MVIKMLLAVLCLTLPVAPATMTSDDDVTARMTQFQSDYPVGDARWCIDRARRTDFNLTRLEVMPGGGWDNLRNLDAGMVVTFNFSQCKVTDDGRLLIPDNVFTVPLKTSQVDSFATVIDSWQNASSMTSHTVNIGGNGFFHGVVASGSFSFEHEHLKTKQVEGKSVTVRVQLRYTRYEVKLQPDFTLSPAFRSRLLRMAADIQLNNLEQARYDAQLLVRDFGTHYLTSVTAGAALAKDDYLKRDEVDSSEDTKTKITVGASANFFHVFGMSASYGYNSDSSSAKSYVSSTTSSKIWSHGGAMLGAKPSTDQWLAGVDANLVPVDRAGEPLSFLITEKMFPELPLRTVDQLEKIVRESIIHYYEVNTIKGCTKLGAPNFSFTANVEDGSCKKVNTNMTFGGVFQTCVSEQLPNKDPCQGLRQVHPQTGKHSCPTGYEPVQLASGTRGSSETDTHCHRCWKFWHGFKCCHDETLHATATYTAYWCAASQPVPQDSGYLFGGLFTNNLENPVTKAKTCPPKYHALRILADLRVCLSDDFELSAGQSLPFGGFFSCQSGNPLATGKVHPVSLKAGRGDNRLSLAAFMAKNTEDHNKKCPEGFSQHLAVTTLAGCSIHYCIRTGALSGPLTPPVKRPPYSDPPALPNSDDLVMFDVTGMTWYKNEAAQEYQQVMMTKVKAATGGREGGGAPASTLSPGAAAGISIIATLASVAVATLIIVAVNKRRNQKQKCYHRLVEERFTPSYGSSEQGPSGIPGAVISQRDA